MELIINHPNVIETEIEKKVSFRGKTETFRVYRIRLDLLYYNDLNDRIATWMSKAEEDGVVLEKDNLEVYNSTLQKYIIDSNSIAFNKTKGNIFHFSQREPGVVLSDGRIIDGNRRFTCLREIFRESSDEKFNYFEAIIINGDSQDRDIKILELELQHGIDKIVDYNPIDKLVGVYRDIIKNQIFTPEQYCKHIDIKLTDMKKMVEKAKLMVEFLEHHNSPYKFHIARELEIDGPLQEMALTKSKIKDQMRWNEYKYVCFDYILANKKGDTTRMIREIGKNALNNHFEIFLENHFETSTLIQNDIGFNEVSVKQISDLRGNLTLQEKLKDNFDTVSEKRKLDEVKDKPSVLIKKAIDYLDSIDKDILTIIDFQSKIEIRSMVSELKLKIESIEELVNA